VAGGVPQTSCEDAAVTVIGVVARLQVQTARLKPGPQAARVYDPSPLREVEALEVGPRGCRGLRDGQWLLDVHHADHPDTRNVALVNGLSVLSRRAEEQLASRYGLAPGTAGDSVLLDTDHDLVLDDLLGELVLETAEGPLAVGDAMVAAPCVEFCRFALGLSVGPVGDDVTQALADLDGGARGFYLSPRAAGVLRPGDRLVRP
jgi:hypothetical protein